MVFDNDTSLYQTDKEFELYCDETLADLRNYIDFHCSKRKNASLLTDTSLFKYFDAEFNLYLDILNLYLWKLYPTIAEIRKYVGSELIELKNVASDRYPYLSEMVNKWWKYSIDDEISKLS